TESVPHGESHFHCLPDQMNENSEDLEIIQNIPLLQGKGMLNGQCLATYGHSLPEVLDFKILTPTFERK
ncbi:hypothetical protein ACQP3C_30415, partial [Escherichia coli]